MSLRSKGLIFILSSPSGGGKSSLSKKLLVKIPNLKLSISATTRPPRMNEQEGVDYYFKTEQEFEKLIDSNLLLEHAIIYNHCYGTPLKYVEEIIEHGFDLLFDIDWQGARQIKEKVPDLAVTIYILPPSISTLKQRLIARGADDMKTIEERMSQAELEMSHASEYDYVVINDDFNETLAQIENIIKMEKAKKLNE